MPPAEVEYELVTPGASNPYSIMPVNKAILGPSERGPESRKASKPRYLLVPYID